MGCPRKWILIWHIDENVIAQKIADNKVNTDKHQRGVDIEEADGIQDIGEKFYTIFGDEVIGEGEQEDFWYASNPAELFEDLFDKDTRPDTLTNSGANSLITMKNFSDIANTMSFTIEFGDSVIKPLLALDLNKEGRSNSLSVLTDDFGETNYYTLIDSDLDVIDENLSVSEVDSFSNFKMSGTVQNNVQRSNGVIGNLLKTRTTTSGTFELIINDTQDLLTSPSLIFENEQGLEQMLLGTRNGKILIYESSSNPILLDSMLFDSNLNKTNCCG